MWSQLSIGQKWIVATVTSFAFAVLAFWVALDGYCCQNRPKNPDPYTGRIYLESMCHGAKVYVTLEEFYAIEWGLPVMGIIAASGFYLFNRWGKPAGWTTRRHIKRTGG